MFKSSNIASTCRYIHQIDENTHYILLIKAVLRIIDWRFFWCSKIPYQHNYDIAKSDNNNVNLHSFNAPNMVETCIILTSLCQNNVCMHISIAILEQVSWPLHNLASRLSPHVNIELVLMSNLNILDSCIVQAPAQILLTMIPSLSSLTSPYKKENSLKSTRKLWIYNKAIVQLGKSL